MFDFAEIISKEAGFSCWRDLLRHDPTEAPLEWDDFLAKLEKRRKKRTITFSSDRERILYEYISSRRTHIISVYMMISTQWRQATYVPDDVLVVDHATLKQVNATKSGSRTAGYYLVYHGVSLTKTFANSDHKSVTLVLKSAAHAKAVYDALEQALEPLKTCFLEEVEEDDDDE